MKNRKREGDEGRFQEDTNNKPLTKNVLLLNKKRAFLIKRDDKTINLEHLSGTQK